MLTFRQKRQIRQAEKEHLGANKQMKFCGLKTKKGEEKKFRLIRYYEERSKENGLNVAGFIPRRESIFLVNDMLSKHQSLECRSKNEVDQLKSFSKYDEGLTKGDIFFGQLNNDTPMGSYAITKKLAYFCCEIEKKRKKL